MTLTDKSMPSAVTKEDIQSGLARLGVKPGMALEIHCSLGSFGHVDGGAMTLIRALTQAVGDDGAIVMPSFRLSLPQPLDDKDMEMGLTLKIEILPDDAARSGMGIVSDTFRTLPGVITGQGLFRVSAWGKDAGIHSKGFHHLIDTGGHALLLGVDIYRLSAMHYVEDSLPAEIRVMFKPPEEARTRYPEERWLVEAWNPPVKPWYTIQRRAYENGFIKDTMIGSSKCMFFQVKDVVGLYRDALLFDPFGLYGLR